MAASGIRCRCNTITARFRNTTAKFEKQNIFRYGGIPYCGSHRSKHWFKVLRSLNIPDKLTMKRHVRCDQACIQFRMGDKPLKKYNGKPKNLPNIQFEIQIEFEMAPGVINLFPRLCKIFTPHSFPFLWLWPVASFA